MARNEKVRGQYASGIGWDVGNVAPSDKWVGEDGAVSDEQPAGVSRLLVAAGDVVRQHMVEVLGGAPMPKRGDVSNDNSPGDASRLNREPLDDDSAPRKPWAKHTKGELVDEITKRNAVRGTEGADQLPVEGTVKELAKALDADDAAAGGSDA